MRLITVRSILCCALFGIQLIQPNPCFASEKVKETLPEDYFLKSWNLLSTPDLERILAREQPSSEEKKRLLDLIKRSDVQMIEQNIESVRKSNPKDDSLILLIDLKKQLSTQRNLLFVKIVARATSCLADAKDVLKSGNEWLFELFNGFSLTANREEAEQIAAVLPLLHQQQFVAEFFSGVRALNRYSLLNGPEAVLNQKAIVTILQELASSTPSTKGGGETVAWYAAPARSLLIDADREYGVKLSRELLEKIDNERSLTDLYNKIPDALIVYCKTLDSGLLNDVIRVGNIVRQHDSTKLRKMYHWHVCAIGSKLIRSGKNEECKLLISYLRDGTSNHFDNEWRGLCGESLNKIENTNKRRN